MSNYYGDIRLGDTLDIKFTTRRFTTGAPFTLAGTPVISAYPGNSTTELTAGITLTADFDARTGLNHIRVVASGANGYATATNYELVITAGTVDSVSVVGETIGSFSIEARSALMPTTAARTLDVSAGGEAGVDWANVGSPTTVVGLSGTTVKTATDVETDTADIQSRLPAALVSGRMDSSVGAMAANVVTATAIAADAITDAKVAADVTIASVTGAVGSVTAGVSVAVGGIAATSFAAGAIDSAAIAADAITSSELAQSAAQEIADEVLNRNLAGGGSGDSRNVRNALRSCRNRGAIVAGTLTVYQEDDTTPAWTAAVTTTAGNPLSEVDPA